MREGGREGRTQTRPRLEDSISFDPLLSLFCLPPSLTIYYFFLSRNVGKRYFSFVILYQLYYEAYY